MKKTDLQRIPGVGKKTEEDLIALGYHSIASLCGETPEKLKWWYWKNHEYPEKRKNNSK